MSTRVSATPSSSTLPTCDDWFVQEVLPLEPMLMGLLRRNWRDHEELVDLRQEVYVRVYEAAAVQRPVSAKAFVIATTRNLLIDRARRAQVVSFEQVADIDALQSCADELTPERHAAGRSELRVLQSALEELSPRCREVVELRKIAGLSQREVADRLGIAEDTVEKQISKGMRALAARLHAGGVSIGLSFLSKGRGSSCKTE